MKHSLLTDETFTVSIVALAQKLQMRALMLNDQAPLNQSCQLIQDLLKITCLRDAIWQAQGVIDGPSGAAQILSCTRNGVYFQAESFGLSIKDLGDREKNLSDLFHRSLRIQKLLGELKVLEEV